MQSSTAVMFRALVMLACLVAIPLAAVVGKSLPDVARGLLHGQWPWQKASASGSLDEAPPFAPASPASPAAEEFVAGGVPQQSFAAQQPFAAQQSFAPQQSLAAPWDASSQGTAALGVVDTAVVQASNELFVPSRPEAARTDWPVAVDLPSRPDVPGAAVGPGATMTPAAPTQLAGPGDSRPRVQMADGQFASIEGRLRQLGATYYMLESWGDQEQLYRFYCRVAVGGNANYTRYFEATHFEPLAAMTEVLNQVETWRAASAAPSGGWSPEPR